MHYRKLNDKSNAAQRIVRLESHLEIKRAQVFHLNVSQKRQKRHVLVGCNKLLFLVEFKTEPLAECYWYFI